MAGRDLRANLDALGLGATADGSRWAVQHTVALRASIADDLAHLDPGDLLSVYVIAGELARSARWEPGAILAEAMEVIADDDDTLPR